MLSPCFAKQIEYFYSEDDLQNNAFYFSQLPQDDVKCALKFKDDMTIAGLPFFFEAFRYLDKNFCYDEMLSFEGKIIQKKDQTELLFELPFNVALTGERIALNLLQRASAIASYTQECVELATEVGVKILDTRKTTPGLRTLEKYAVRIGGGYNHRMGQTDVWMVKDNHKKFFGGLKQAVNFFASMQSMYNSMVVEIHDLEELEEAISLGLRHVMLDNFSKDEIEKAISLKKNEMTYEVSGGVTKENLKDYLIKGVDAISMGALTYQAPHKDISLKYSRSH